MRCLFTFLLVLFGLLLQVNLVEAQRMITGMVKGVLDSLAISGATITYGLEKNLGGTTTLSDGSFSLKLSSEATTLRITFVGMRDQLISLPQGRQSVDLGVIYLEEDSQSLGEVSVQAEVRSVDKTLHFPSAQSLKISSSFLSLLETMALRGLRVDEVMQTVSVDGGAVQWQINGVPKAPRDVHKRGQPAYPHRQGCPVCSAS